MAKLSLRHIYKVYPNGVKAVNDFNMEIDDNEFIVFVGPSGCGKSTTLRMIAGLEEISAGELFIDDELVNNVEPKDRDISMVFQNYALYPHMTVYDNMAFGLKLRHISQKEIHQKVLWAANALKLTEYLDRKPRAMSGGQRQRVALGRAILRNPKVFLLDEPLSNLDAKLRTEMRAEIAKIHNTLKTTFIYVTHDQVEAMTLGSRVVVMKAGYIQQIDTPQNLYQYPENKFVAGFIGTPQMNFFDVTLLRNKEKVEIKFDKVDATLNVAFNDLIKVNPQYLNGNKKVSIGIRCENVSVVDKDSKDAIKMRISHFEELGSETLIYGDLNVDNHELGDDSTNIIVKSHKGSMGLKSDDVIYVSFDISKIHLFDSQTEESIVPRIPSVNVFDCSITNNVLSFENQSIELPNAILSKDVANGELYVPVDAISFDGNIKATVTNVEQIKDQKVIYLKVADRVFFTTNKDVNVGDIVNIKIDLKKITVKENGVNVINPLNVNSEFIGSFTNLENDKQAIKSMIDLHAKASKDAIDALNLEKELKLGDLGLNDALEKRCKEQYKENVSKAKNDLSYKLGTLDLSKEGKKRLVSENKQLLDDYKKEYDQQLEKLANSKKEISEESKKQGETIIKEYDEKIKDLQAKEDSYKKCLLNGSSSLRSFASKDIADANEKLKEVLADLSNKENSELASIAPENEQEIKKIKDKYENLKDEAISNSKVFYLSVNGIYVKSLNQINKKIIQALGTAVFTANYRFYIGNESLYLSEDGFDAKVSKILDYGENEKYLECEAFGRNLFVKVNELLPVGSDVKISFNMDDIIIYENKFDIRLY